MVNNSSGVRTVSMLEKQWLSQNSENDGLE